MAICNDAKQWGESVSIYKQHVRPLAGGKLSPAFAELLLEASSQLGDVRGCLAVVEEMMALGLQPASHAFDRLIHACTYGASGQGELGLRLLGHMRRQGLEVSVVQANRVLQGLAKAKLWQPALQLLDDMLQHGQPPPDRVSFNTVVTACAMAAQWMEALGVANRMQRVGGLQPDLWTYNSLMLACARGKQLSLVLGLMRGMPAPLVPDALSYNAALKACAQVGEGGLALQLLDEMEGRGLQPDLIGFTRAMGACRQSGRWRDALQLLARMEQPPPRQEGEHVRKRAATRGGRDGQPLKPDGWVINLAVWTCVEAGRLEEALDLIRRYGHSTGPEGRGRQDLTEAARAVLKAARRRGDESRVVRELLHAMQGHEEGDKDENGRGAAASLEQEVLRAFDQGVGRDLAGFKLLLEICAVLGLPQLAWPLMEKAEAVDLKPDAWCFKAGVRACSVAATGEAREGARGGCEQALTLLQRMKQAGLVPDADTLQMVVHACAKAGQWGEARRLLQEMAGQIKNRRQQQQPATSPACEPDSSSSSEVVEAMQQVVAMGLPAHSPLYGLVMDACLSAGYASEAVQLADELRRVWARESAAAGTTTTGGSKGPTSSTYLAMLRAYSSADRQGGWAACLDVLEADMLAKERRGRSLRLSYNHFSITLEACIRANQPRAALRVLCLMEDQHFTPEQQCYSRVVRALAKGGEEADGMLAHVLRRMEAGGAAMDEGSAATLLQYWGQRGLVTRMTDFLGRRRIALYDGRTGLTPSSVLLVSAIEALGGQGRWDHALAVLHAVHGFPLTEAVRGAVLDACASERCQPCMQWPVSLYLYDDWRLQGRPTSWRLLRLLLQGMDDEALLLFSRPYYQEAYELGLVDHRSAHEWPGRVDLHYFSRQLAKAALWFVLTQDTSEPLVGRRGLSIVPGRGQRSVGSNSREGSAGQAVLKPEVLHFLRHVLRPPLQVFEVPNNPGRLHVPTAVVRDWQEAFRKSKS